MWSAFEIAPVFLIDGLVHTISVSALVGLDVEESSQTVLLAQGKCNWVRSHLIVWTQYPSPVLHIDWNDFHRSYEAL